MSGEGNINTFWGAKSRTTGHISIDDWVYNEEAANPSQRVSTDCGNQSGGLLFRKESDGSDKSK